MIALSLAAMTGVITAADHFAAFLHGGPTICIGGMLLAGAACPQPYAPERFGAQP